MANKPVLKQILEAQDKQSGFIVDITARPQKARELMLARAFALRTIHFRVR